MIRIVIEMENGAIETVRIDALDRISEVLIVDRDVDGIEDDNQWLRVLEGEDVLITDRDLKFDPGFIDKVVNARKKMGGYYGRHKG